MHSGYIIMLHVLHFCFESVYDCYCAYILKGMALINTTSHLYFID